VVRECPDVGQRPIAGVAAGELLEALVRGLCLSAVVPVALDAVERAPLASAGCFPGDVLRGLMEVPGGFWARHPRLYDRYRSALRAGAAARRQLPRDQRMTFWAALDASTLAAGVRGGVSGCSDAPATPHDNEPGPSAPRIP
jgi:hypothetical protein